MGLLDFVEQDDAVGVAAHGFGEHSPFAVAHIAGRAAFQAAHGVRFLVLAHVDGDELLLAAVERFGQGERGFGLADAAGADEQEHALGFVRVFQVGARGAHALRHGVQGLGLADDALFEHGLQVHDGGDLVLDHLAQRDAGPRGDDLGDDEAIDLDRDEWGLALQRGEFLQLGLQLGRGRLLRRLLRSLLGRLRFELGAQLAAGQSRLEQIGRVAAAGRTAGVDHRVRFVDEQNDRVRALLDFVDDVLQAVLAERAASARSS